MPIALISPEPPPPLLPPRKLWTREECDRFASAGLLEYEHLELVNGELISRIGKNRPHVNAAMALMLWLMDACGRDRVDQEAPIDVAPGDNQINEPTPDLIVLRKPGSLIRSGNPQPEDLAMVVEIADSSLAFDLGVKARLYARAGIAEYWVADLNGRHLVVHRKPGAEGYGDVAAYGETEAVRPLAAPEHEFLLNAIL
jgi:hypothetical protein